MRNFDILDQEQEEEDKEENALALPGIDAENEEVIQALDMVRDHLVGGGRLDERTHEAFNAVLRNHSSRIQAGMVAIALQRFGQLAVLTKNMGDIEAEVGRRVKEGLIKASSTKDLAILYRAFSDREKGLIGFLGTIADGGLPDKLADDLSMADVEEDLAAKGIDGVPKPESRENVIRMLKKLAREGT